MNKIRLLQFYDYLIDRFNDANKAFKEAANTSSLNKAYQAEGYLQACKEHLVDFHEVLIDLDIREGLDFEIDEEGYLHLRTTDIRQI